MKIKVEFQKWRTYQAERFPLVQYVPMVAAFSFCAVSYSAVIRGADFSWAAFASAFLTSLGFFMLLRIADEFKDFDDDAKYRPYRPVPRGLIKLQDLAVLGVAILLLQAVIAGIYYFRLLLLLCIVWAYFGLMSKEFFVPRWLKDHPLTYMWTHMLIMPLIDFYATACEWLPATGSAASTSALGWFLAASFFNGAVVEIGRKIRSEQDEEAGVETYTVLWGNTKAVRGWLVSMGLSLAMALLAGWWINALLVVGVLLISLFLLCLWAGSNFLQSPTSNNAKRFEKLSGVWVLSMYLSLGLFPLLLK